MKFFQLSILYLRAYFWTAAQVYSLQDAALFNQIDANLCINAEFILTYSEERTIAGCSYRCALRLRCQAFSLADGPCRLFEFDKCSKSVRDCGSCSRRGPVFVRQQPGLGAGALCPAGYGNEMCGVRYGIFGPADSSMSWEQGKRKCDSESGLVIMADVTSAAEMSHIDSWYPRIGSSSTPSVWLGCIQEPGSAEPAGGWKWINCGASINASLWRPTEPNDDSKSLENVCARISQVLGLVDAPDNFSIISSVLCECLSPF